MQRVTTAPSPHHRSASLDLSRSAHAPLDAERERQLARRFLGGDRSAGELLVRANLPFVISIAREYRRWGIPMEDLIQQGCLGLLKAASRFDPDHGCRLVTYAAFWIRAEIREYVVRGHRMVRIGTTKGERRAVRLFRRTGELDPGRLAAATGLSIDRAERLLPMLAGRDIPLDDAPAFGGAPVERIPSECPTPEEGVAERESELEAQKAIRDLLDTLAPREQIIVRERWLEETPATLEQLGAEFGISKERVRQIEQRIRERLRIRLERRQRMLLAS